MVQGKRMLVVPLLVLVSSSEKGTLPPDRLHVRSSLHHVQRSIVVPESDGPGSREHFISGVPSRQETSQSTTSTSKIRGGSKKQSKVAVGIDRTGRAGSGACARMIDASEHRDPNRIDLQ